jgi:hypothetical protein
MYHTNELGLHLPNITRWKNSKCHQGTEVQRIGAFLHGW